MYWCLVEYCCDFLCRVSDKAEKSQAGQFRINSIDFNTCIECTSEEFSFRFYQNPSILHFFGIPSKWQPLVDIYCFGVALRVEMKSHFFSGDCETLGALFSRGLCALHLPITINHLQRKIPGTR